MPPPKPSSNNTDPLGNIETLLLSQTQTPAQAAFMQESTKEIQQVLRKLSAKTPRFRSTGICLLGITDGDREEEVPLAIRSVPMEVMSRLLEEAYVEPPRTKKMDIRSMEFEMVKDEWDPAYQRKLQQANVRFLMRFTLHALDCELEDEEGRIVWSPDAGIRDEAAAMRVLERQGFTQTHYTQIRTDVERLSQTEHQYAEALRLKKSLER